MYKCRCDVLYRKKTKTSKVAATEVVSHNLHSSSIDKNDKPESDKPEEETENDLPVSQCRPMLLSQTGKFIPKFVAKKKITECMVKIECVSKLVVSDNCSVPVSETEIHQESQSAGTSSVADEVKDSGSADSSVAATNIHKDTELVLVECMAGLVDNPEEHGVSENGQFTSLNNGSTEGTDSNKPELPVDTVMVVKDTGSSEHSGDDCEGCTNVEVTEDSTMNGDVLGEIQHNTNPANASQHDVKDAASNISSEVAVCMPDAETAPVDHADCTEPTSLQIADDENSERPADTVEAKEDNKAVGNNHTNTMPELNSEDASDRIHCVVAEICGDISPVPETVRNDAEANSDAVCDDDNERKVAINDDSENNGSKTPYIAVSQSDTVTGETCAKGKTEAGRSDPGRVDSTATIAETDGDDTEVNTVTEAREITTASSEPPFFDDFLDLTDSQLCQLDDLSR